MTPFSLFSRTAVRAAVLGVAVTVALTACGGETKGVISSLPSGTGTSTPATTAPAGSGSAPAATASSSGPEATEPAAPDGAGDAEPAKPTTPVKTVASDVSQLKALGVDVNASILIDVADDGVDRYLEVGEGGVVDFTATSGSPDSMMALNPARVAKRTEETRNRVVIAPPFYNEDLGAGSCVADTANGKLRLATCKAGAASQIWTVVPAGDSGQFELHGVHTTVRVDDDSRITTGPEGRVGLQTIKYTE
jgi:hypothetical protein